MKNNVTFSYGLMKKENTFYSISMGPYNLSENIYPELTCLVELSENNLNESTHFVIFIY